MPCPFTLSSSAAQQILRDLLRPAGAGSMLKDSERLIRPEKREEVRTLFNEAQNFFKHADADPNKVLEFRPAVNDFVLFDCFCMYQLYTGQHLKEGLGFVAWFASVHREILVAGRETEAQSKWHENDRSCNRRKDRCSTEGRDPPRARTGGWSDEQQILRSRECPSTTRGPTADSLVGSRQHREHVQTAFPGARGSRAVQAVERDAANACGPRIPPRWILPRGTPRRSR